MGRLTGERTLRSLLDASHSIIARQGAARLTLDAVVSRAGVSKGALLHHFRSKDELARRIIHDAIEGFDARVEQIRGTDRSVGSYTRAYITASIAPQDAASRRSFQVIAALARDAKYKHCSRAPCDAGPV